MPNTSKHEALLTALRALIDVGSIAAAYAAAIAIRIPEDASWRDFSIAGLPYLIAFSIVWCVVAFDQRLFVSRRSESIVSQLFSVSKTFFSTVLFSAFFLALIWDYDYRDFRDFFLMLSLLSLISLLVVRLAMGLGLWNLRRRGWNTRRIIIIGANDRTRRLVEVFLANEHFGYSIEGFLDDDVERRPLLEEYGTPYLGAVQNLEQLLVDRVIDAVYVSLPVRSCYETIQSIAHLCEGVGVPVRFLADLFPLRMAASDITRLDGIPMLSLAHDPALQTRFALNRAIDIGVSLILLIILAPVFLLIALLIKLESKGPVFTAKERRLADNRSIRLLSFRVCKDGEAEAPPHTAVGGFLHRYGLDKLPQIINVLRGQMSFAGPVSRTGGQRKADSPV